MKMGFDVEVFILNGFKLQLSDAFEKEWIDPSIMEEDDWQYLNMGEDLDRIVDKYVEDYNLRDLLKVGWSLYILASTQEDIDFEKSFLFIYIDKDEIDLDCGEYVVEEISTDMEKLSFPEFQHLDLENEDWKLHCVVNSSW